MQYHWVVCYDEDTNKFEIDWDLTYHALDGIAFDDTAPAYTGEAWYGVGDLSVQQEIDFEGLSAFLETSLDKLPEN